MNDSTHEIYEHVIAELGMRGAGNDTTPLVTLVRDEPYSRGCVTSSARTASDQYQAFLERARRARK